MTAPDYSIILNHPLNQEIISKLITGTDPKEINQWLKLKYPNKEDAQKLFDYLTAKLAEIKEPKRHTESKVIDKILL